MRGLVPCQAFRVRDGRAIAVAWRLDLLDAARRQDRLKAMPGYEQYQKMSREIPGSVKLGSITAQWKEDGLVVRVHLGRQALSLRRRDEAGDRHRRRARRERRPVAPAGAAAAGRAAGDAGARPAVRFGRVAGQEAQGVLQGPQHLAERGRRQQCRRPQHRRQREGSRSSTAPRAGSTAKSSAQRTAMWWSPDSRKLAYYRFDEKPVPDYYLQMNQTQVQDTLDVEAYPKPGKPNPIVDLFVYDVAAKKPSKIDVRDGKPFDNTRRRPLRLQHLVVAGRQGDPAEPDQSQAEHPRVRRLQSRDRQVPRHRPRGVADRLDRKPSDDPLSEGRQAVHLGVAAQRLVKNFYLYDLSGKLIAPLTTHTTFEADNIVLVDEARNLLFYTARDGDNHMKLQLHRVGLDGKERQAPDRSGVHCTPSTRRPTASTSSTSRRRTTRRRSPG